MMYNDKHEEYKYKSWIFTWNSNDNGFLIPEEKLYEILTEIAEDYVFQKEFVSRHHYQGFFKLKLRARKRTVLNLFKIRCTGTLSEAINGLTILRSQGTDEQAIAYATKEDSRVSPPVYSSGYRPYSMSDLAVLSQKDRWYPWQVTLSHLLEDPAGGLTQPDDRSIIWIKDMIGCSGKSKLVKHYVYKFSKEIIKLPFGSASQLRSSVCTAGPKRLYFIDIPRTMARDEDLDSVYSVIEDIKNGFVTTSMYGKFQQLLFEPPHVVIFSNKDCPLGKLSKDRWKEYAIVNNNLKKI